MHVWAFSRPIHLTCHSFISKKHAGLIKVWNCEMINSKNCQTQEWGWIVEKETWN